MVLYEGKQKTTIPEAGGLTKHFKLLIIKTQTWSVGDSSVDKILAMQA